MKRLLTAGIALAVVLVGLSMVLFASPTRALAAAIDLSGYAWSENVGWISFKGPTYGVTLSNTTGLFSGHAWSENIGWISFQQADGTSCGGGALMNLATGAVSGWAKVLSTGACVHLAGTGYAVAYTSATSRFSGYAWSDTDVGWIHFAGTNYAVVTDSTLTSDSTINVTVSPTSAGWTLYKDGVQFATGVGNGTATVTPSASGSSISITGGSVAGYDSPPDYTNSQGGGSSLTLFGGETIGFTLTYTRAFDYTLSNGGTVTVEEGGTNQFGQVVIHEALTGTSGASQAVSLSASGQPSGVSTAFSTCTPGSKPNCDSTLTITVAPTTNPGTYPVTITGSPLGKTTTFSLIINAASGMSVTCSRTPSSAHVGDTVHWSSSVSQNPAHPPYTYLWSGTNIPSNITDSGFDIVYSTTGTKTADVTVRDSKDNISHCIPAGSINIGVSPIFEEF
ncbi:hypothetical protein KW800_01195 [Candidatus Parcubacteria bacterium]|nr:hypothetical protein [Candidatus Parcubacteria bacterium]